MLNKDWEKFWGPTMGVILLHLAGLSIIVVFAHELTSDLGHDLLSVACLLLGIVFEVVACLITWAWWPEFVLRRNLDKIETSPEALRAVVIAIAKGAHPRSLFRQQANHVLAAIAHALDEARNPKLLGRAAPYAREAEDVLRRWIS